VPSTASHADPDATDGVTVSDPPDDEMLRLTSFVWPGSTFATSEEGFATMSAADIPATRKNAKQILRLNKRMEFTPRESLASFTRSGSTDSKRSQHAAPLDSEFLITAYKPLFPLEM
jgi:hypothetical protein